MSFLSQQLVLGFRDTYFFILLNYEIKLINLKIVGTSYKRRTIRHLILHPALKGLVWLWVVPAKRGGNKNLLEKNLIIT